MFDSAPVGIHIQSAEGTLQRVNQAFLDILGYAEDECIGRNWAEYHVDSDLAQKLLDRIASGEEVRNCEVTLSAKDGSSRFTLVSADPVSQSGTILGARCFTRDITELKQAQLALVAADRRKAAILDASLDAIVTMDA